MPNRTLDIRLDSLLVPHNILEVSMKIKLLTIATLAALSTVAYAHDIGHEHEHVEGGGNAKAGFVSDGDVKAELWNPRGKPDREIAERAAYIT